MAYLNHNPEGEPFFVYNSSEGEVYGTPDNTAIYSFDWMYRGVDHIYTAQRDCGDYTSGSYLFRIATLDRETMYDDLVLEMVEAGYEEHYEEVPDDNDMKVFNLHFEAHYKKPKNKHIRKWLEGEDGTDS